MLREDMRRTREWFEQSKWDITNFKFSYSNSELLLQMNCKKNSQIGIFQKRKEKIKRMPKKKKKTTGTPTPNNLKGPTITRPKALPFWLPYLYPFFLISHYNLPLTATIWSSSILLLFPQSNPVQKPMNKSNEISIRNNIRHDSVEGGNEREISN